MSMESVAVDHAGHSAELEVSGEVRCCCCGLDVTSGHCLKGLGSPSRVHVPATHQEARYEQGGVHRDAAEHVESLHRAASTVYGELEYSLSLQTDERPPPATRSDDRFPSRLGG